MEEEEEEEEEGRPEEAVAPEVDENEVKADGAEVENGTKCKTAPGTGND